MSTEYTTGVPMQTRNEEGKDLKGILYAQGAAKLEETSFLAKLSGTEILPWNVMKTLAFNNSSAAQLVGENGVKEVGSVSLVEESFSEGKTVLMSEFTREYLKWDESSQTDAVEGFVKSQSVKLQTAVDVAITHGTDARTGTPASEISGTRILDHITKNAVNEVLVDDSTEALDQAIRDAIAHVNNGNKGIVNGIAISHEAHTKLSQWENTLGSPRLPGFSLDPRATANYRGIAAVTTRAITHSADVTSDGAPDGTETDIIAIVGDFSKVRISLDFDAAEVISDDLDLKKRNKVLFFAEAWFKYLVSNPSDNFVVIRKAPVDPEA